MTAEDVAGRVDGAPIVSYRVGAHVDYWNGYPGAILEIRPNLLKLTLHGALTRLFHPTMYGKTLTHEGPDVCMTRARWEPPWRRAALLLYKAERPAMVELSASKADSILRDLERAGFQLESTSLSFFNGAVALLEAKHFRYWHPRGRRQG